jgi:phosphoglycolate phosphatase-like HAD superfamily hydrolase
MSWLRPGLADEWWDVRLDTALFDVDGVLIDVSQSFRQSVVAATEHIVRKVYGFSDAPDPLLTEDEGALFKRAGGFNSDWDLTRLLSALWIARLREWQSQPEASLTLADWAARASEAAHAGHGGLEWMHATIPASAIPSAEVARWAEDEYYWGAALVRQHYGHEPIFATDAPGLVHGETMLLQPDLLPALIAAGISRFGLITGRVGPEITWVLSRLCEVSGLIEGAPPECASWADDGFGRSPFGVIVHGEMHQKPDPAALAHALRALGALGAIYVGDTRDDLHLVLRYRSQIAAFDPTLPPVLAVSIAEGDDATAYRDGGADIVLGHIGGLPAALTELHPHAD